MAEHRIGVFICWCGSNIAGTIHVDQLRDGCKTIPGVVHAEHYMYMCSDPGQDLIKNGIKDKGFDGVVVASCSPRMHERTFRKAAGLAGLNPFKVEIANVREQCAWVHRSDKDWATSKALSIIKAAVEKVTRNEELEPISVDITRKAMVVGAGIGGITAALDLADSGWQTVVVERSPKVGGKVAELAATYPHHRTGQELLAPLVERLEGHDKVTLLTDSTVTDVDGYVGNFTIKVKCESGPEPTEIIENVGGVILTTGYNLYPLANLENIEFTPDTIDGLAFEKLLAEAAEKGGPVRRPSDGKVVESAVFVQCSGSRDPENHKPYCSRICCMYTAKQASLLGETNPDARAVVCFMDARTDVKGGEEYWNKQMEEHGITYLRCRPSKVAKDGDRLMVNASDTLTGYQLDIPADMVVFATAVVPAESAAEVSTLFRAATDNNGFFQEGHIKLRPVESASMGVYLAGGGQYPKDIADTVAQARGAASKIQTLFANEQLAQDPMVARVDPEICAGCGLCVNLCPYGAREVDPAVGWCRVNEPLCQGCGACAAVCPNKATSVKNDTQVQVLNQVIALTEPDVSLKGNG